MSSIKQCQQPYITFVLLSTVDNEAGELANLYIGVWDLSCGHSRN